MTPPNREAVQEEQSRPEEPQIESQQIELEQGQGGRRARSTSAPRVSRRRPFMSVAVEGQGWLLSFDVELAPH